MCARMCVAVTLGGVAYGGTGGGNLIASVFAGELKKDKTLFYCVFEDVKWWRCLN